jgi:hypothetical protein
MKIIKIHFIIFALAALYNCADMQSATKEDFGNLSAVRAVWLEKDIIYDSAMLYINTFYKSSQKVIQQCDKSAGIITVNGSVEIDVKSIIYYLNYRLTINVKDTIYKIQLDPIDVDVEKGLQPSYIWPEFARGFNVEFNRINSTLFAFIEKRKKNNKTRDNL